MPPGFPAIMRPPGLAKASSPGMVPEPEHHHLPAWVRRAYAQARPILADQMGALGGESRNRLDTSISELNSLISSGKFSQAFRYAELIALGERLLEAQRKEQAEAARVRRVLETARRKVADQLRDAAVHLPPDALSRLNKALRSAPDPEAVAAVGAELDQATESARSVQLRRREREIDRTRTRIQRSAPKSVTSTAPAEDWQEVLRRLQEQMTAGSTSN
jgi:hypothetical protein